MILVEQIISVEGKLDLLPAAPSVASLRGTAIREAEEPSRGADGMDGTIRSLLLIRWRQPTSPPAMLLLLLASWQRIRYM